MLLAVFLQLQLAQIKMGYRKGVITTSYRLCQLLRCYIIVQ
jgi:hypothetical protein